MVSYPNVRRAFLWHQLAVLLIIAVVGISIAWLNPFEMNFVERSFFLLILSVGHLLSMERMSEYVGYGVGEEINDFAGYLIVPNSRLSENRFAPLSLWDSWVKSVRIGMVLGLVFASVYLIPVMPSSVLSFFRLVIWSFAGYFLALVGECCIWMASGRHVYWKLPEKLFRERLRNWGCEFSRINVLTRQAKERSLILPEQ